MAKICHGKNIPWQKIAMEIPWQFAMAEICHGLAMAIFCHGKMKKLRLIINL
jgi:hypothetical protein